jgi:enoyl-CoA hydratase/carnithine racemase
MSEPAVLIEERENILEVVFNRPDKLNAINLEMSTLLAEATDRFGSRPDLRVMLIRANGRYFSAGADINDVTFYDQGDSPRTPSGFRKWYRSGHGCLHPIFDELEAIEKPVVVAHQGPCFGGGLEMSVSCDFRLAAKSATYAMPEITIGALPGSGGTSRLTRLIGTHWARMFLMANLTISADKALIMGLVHEVFEDADFEQNVWDFCRNLAAQPPEVVGAAKLAIELVADLERGQGRSVERLANSSLVLGDEYRRLVHEMRSALAAKHSSKQP